MKAIERMKELSGNILMLQHQLNGLELLDEQEINAIIVDCLVETEEEEE